MRHCVEIINTGDRMEDYNQADLFIQENGGRIVAFADCLCIVRNDDCETSMFH